MLAYLYLALAIVAEVIGTSALKASDGFTRLLPSAITAAGYAVAFYCLALTLRSMPVSIAYAIWSGAGIVLISLVAFFVYGQRLDWPAAIGMGFIIVGVVLMNGFSKAVAH
ncbi:hypothetical protein DFQ28_004526 [Apophysomyces sp. BC1034]|nr:hypothetical protein DFQ28_004526 [Apophysomyces sp. BC1034]